MTEPKRVYTFKQFLELVPVSDKTLRRWDATGKIKTVHLGPRLKGIPSDEVERVVKDGVAA